MRSMSIFLMALMGTWLLDQGIKELFVAGFDWQSRCLSLELHYNRGVAFSFLAGLGPWLKWLQATLVGGIAWYLWGSGMLRKHPWVLGMLIGAALSNLYDRFVHIGVVDYVAWHCGFDYAVFNYADVVIDLTIGWFVLRSFLDWRRESRT